MYTKLGWVLLAAVTLQMARAGVVYVDVAAVGANDGTSWADAYSGLQQAVTNAPSDSELWVRAGVYAPLTLRTNLSLYGGFNGSETNLAARDWRANVSTVEGGGGQAVAFARNARLDGFLITNSAGDSGIFFDRVHGTLANCTLDGHNGGAAVRLTSPGGQIGGHTRIENCNFLNGSDGAAIYYYGRSNIYVGPHTVDIDRCTFTGNQSSGRGAAISTDHAGHWLTVANCIFNQNSADVAGGAIYSGYSIYGPGTPMSVINCTFVSNACVAGKAVCVSFQSAAIALQNCIIWGATNDQVRTQSDTPSVSLAACALEGGFGSVYPRHGTATDLGGHITADPQFVDADGADDLAGTLDDNLRVEKTSPCIDAGLAVGAPTHDRDGQVRPQGVAVDIGAYEYVSGPAGLLMRVR